MTGGVQSLTLEIENHGVHTFNIWTRKDGTQVDKVVLNTSGIAPTDLGPDESDRVPRGNNRPQSLTASSEAPAELSSASPASHAGLSQWFNERHLFTALANGQAFAEPQQLEEVISESIPLLAVAAGNIEDSSTLTLAGEAEQEAASAEAFAQFDPWESLLSL